MLKAANYNAGQLLTTSQIQESLSAIIIYSAMVCHIDHELEPLSGLNTTV